MDVLKKKKKHKKECQSVMSLHDLTEMGKEVIIVSVCVCVFVGAGMFVCVCWCVCAYVVMCYGEQSIFALCFLMSWWS